MSKFRQPCCDDCWFDNYPGRTPTRVIQRPKEKCCYCGKVTHSGIYIRIDPTLVPHPSEET